MAAHVASMRLDTGGSDRLRTTVPKTLSLLLMGCLLSACGRVDDSPTSQPQPTATGDAGDVFDAAREASTDTAVAIEDATPPPPSSTWATGVLCDPAVPRGFRKMVSAGDLVKDGVSAAAWNGHQMLFATSGGNDCSRSPCYPMDSVVAYDPAADSWHPYASVHLYERKVEGPLLAYGDHVARVDLASGNYWVHAPGAGGDPTANGIPRAGTCVSYGAAVVGVEATGEIFVWGGGGWTDGPEYLPCAQGIALSGPTPRVVAPAPATFKGGHASAIWVSPWIYVFAWNDRRLGKYDPVKDLWVDLGPIPVSTSRDAPEAIGVRGDQLAFYGGEAFDGDEGSFVSTDGARFDVASSSWLSLPAELRSPAGDTWRKEAATWFQPGPSGIGEVVLYGGYGYDHDDLLSDMIAVDLKSAAWRRIDTTGGLGARQGALAAWDGCEAIVYGGHAGTAVLEDGAIYKP